MADYIDREALIERIREIYCSECKNYNGVRCRACQIGDSIDMIDDAPTTDVEHVIRCKDCKYCKEFHTKRYKQTFYKCCRMGKYDMDYFVKPNDFCSYGNRKEKNDG